MFTLRFFLPVLFLFLSASLRSQELENIEFNQLHYPLYQDPGTVSLIGTVTFEYAPPPEPMFLNIIASGPNTEPMWIVQNAYLVEDTYSSLPTETQTMYFSLENMGYPEFLPGGQINIKYFITNTLFKELYIPLPHEYTLYNMNVRDVRIHFSNIIDWINPDSLFPNFNWTLPLTITPHFWIGCNMPNYDLHGDAGIEGCGPAATTNSMNWLDDTNGSFNLPGTMDDHFRIFSNLMQKKPKKGVGFSNFVRAKLDFIEMYDLPIVVEYQAYQGNPASVSSSSGNSSASCANGSGNIYPNKAWFVDQGKNGADVELWLGNYNSNMTGNHIVVLTGSVNVNGTDFISFKHDFDQENKDDTNTTSTEQVGTAVSETTPGWGAYIDGVSVSGGVSNNRVHYAVSERVVPGHKPRPKKLTFKHFCTSDTVIVPPNSTVTFSYPTDSTRNYNSNIYTTYYEPEKQFHSNQKNQGQWNNNSGQQRSFSNDSAFPQFVIMHCNDNQCHIGDESTAYDVDFNVQQNPIMKGGEDSPLNMTTPFNPEDFAGFSIGYDDDSHNEFSEITDSKYEYVFGQGAYLRDGAARLSVQYVKNYIIKFKIHSDNIYWDKTEFVLGVDSVVSTGRIIVMRGAEGFSDTLAIDGKGDYTLRLPKLVRKDTFELVISAIGNTDFFIDNMAVRPIAKSITTGLLDKTEYCTGDSLAVEFALYYPTSIPNTFAAVLYRSDGIGEDLIIGETETNNSDEINCSIPLSISESSLYRIRVENESSGVKGTDNSDDILINIKPEKPEISRNDNTLISSSETGNQWYLNGMMIDNAADRKLEPEKEGKYAVIVTNEAGCISETSDEFEFEFVGIDENETGPYVYAANNKLYIRYSENRTGLESINILNLFGQSVLVIHSTGDKVYDLSQLASGVYFLIIDKGISTDFLKICITN